MGGEGLPSVDDLKGFGGELGKFSPSQLSLEVSEDSKQAWVTAINDAVTALQQAVAAKPKGRVNVGAVSDDYESARQTASNLNDSGDSVHANIEANLQAAQALQNFMHIAFGAITTQSESAGG